MGSASTLVVLISEFHPEDFQDEEDKKQESAECVCDVMMSDQELSKFVKIYITYFFSQNSFSENV